MACLLEEARQVVVTECGCRGLHSCVSSLVSRIQLAPRDRDPFRACLGLGRPPGRSHPCTDLGPADTVGGRPVRCSLPAVQPARPSRSDHIWVVLAARSAAAAGESKAAGPTRCLA
jgi:hypothetical protein